MAFHATNMGAYAPATRDMNGYVPEADDGPWDLAFDHGTERTHGEDGELTEYGEWWEEDGWPELRDRAVHETAEAAGALREWQDR